MVWMQGKDEPFKRPLSPCTVPLDVPLCPFGSFVIITSPVHSVFRKVRKGRKVPTFSTLCTSVPLARSAPFVRMVWRQCPVLSSCFPAQIHVIGRSNSFLNASSPVVTICTTCFNTLKLCILPTQCVCVFRMILTISSDCFPKQH
jgi:hypothetical protein